MNLLKKLDNLVSPLFDSLVGIFFYIITKFILLIVMFIKTFTDSPWYFIFVLMLAINLIVELAAILGVHEEDEDENKTGKKCDCCN